MPFKSFSYLLPKPQNQLTKCGQNFSKKSIKCFKNWTLKKNFIEEIHFSGTFFIIDIFWKLQFLKHLKHFLLKLCPFFVSWFWSFGKRYENDLTDGIFETGANGVPTKSQNHIISGQGGPSSTQYSNPSWAWRWYHPFGTIPNHQPPSISTQC